MISTAPPFVLRLSKDERRVFQQNLFLDFLVQPIDLSSKRLVLVDLGTEKIPFEIKLHSAPTAHDAAMLRQCMHQLNLTRGYLIHSGRENYSLGKGVTALSAEQVLSRPQTLPR